jgi:anti-sigma B factor antagonist
MTARRSALPDDFSLTDHALGDGRNLLKVSGVVDLFTAPELKDRALALLDHSGRELVLDLSQATYIDSTGLGALLSAAKRAELLGGRMVIVNVDEHIARIFEITGLDTILAIVPTRTAALTTLDERAERAQKG